MIETALKNLKLLNFGIDYYQDKYLIPEGIQLSLIPKDNFDPINNLQLLEYPVYFTYNQVLNEISDNCALTYKQKKYLLRKTIIKKQINVYSDKQCNLCVCHALC